MYPEDLEDLAGEIYELADQPSPEEIASMMAPVLVELRIAEPSYYILSETERMSA